MDVEVSGARTSRVWRYDLVRDRIAAAGSGERYRATATDDQSLALLHRCEKSAPWEDDIERLRNAIAVASRPEIDASPYLCTLLDISETDETSGEWSTPGKLTAIWEWADCSLHELMQNRLTTDRPIPELSASVKTNVSGALKTLHEAGVVHLDVAPNNILSVSGRWKLGDFDIAVPIGAPVGERGPQHPFRHPARQEAETAARPEFDLYGLARILEWISAREPGIDVCVECGQPIGDDGGWYSDGTGELVPYCAECAAREFGSDVP